MQPRRLAQRLSAFVWISVLCSVFSVVAYFWQDLTYEEVTNPQDFQHLRQRFRWLPGPDVVMLPQLCPSCASRDPDHICNLTDIEHHLQYCSKRPVINGVEIPLDFCTCECRIRDD